MCIYFGSLEATRIICSSKLQQFACYIYFMRETNKTIRQINNSVIGLSCLILNCDLLLTEPLAFVKQPQNVLKGYTGQKLVIDCSTNDVDVSVFLLHKRHPFAAFTERKPKENKLWKKGQVFSLLDLDLGDTGIYTCEARNRANESIRWPAGTGYLMLSRGKVIIRFILIIQRRAIQCI